MSKIQLTADGLMQLLEGVAYLSEDARKSYLASLSTEQLRKLEGLAEDFRSTVELEEDSRDVTGISSEQ